MPYCRIENASIFGGEAIHSRKIESPPDHAPMIWLWPVLEMLQHIPDKASH